MLRYKGTRSGFRTRPTAIGIFGEACDVRPSDFYARQKSQGWRLNRRRASVDRRASGSVEADFFVVIVGVAAADTYSRRQVEAARGDRATELDPAVGARDVRTSHFDARQEADGRRLDGR